MNTTSPSISSRKLSLLFVVMLIAAACGTSQESSTSEDGTLEQPDESVSDTTTTEAPVAAEPETGHNDAADSHDEEDHASEADSHSGAGSDEELGHGDDAAGGEEPDHGGERVVDVLMTDFAFSPAVVNAVAGETITFSVVNDGAIVHEFRLSNAHRIEEHLASGHDGHDEDGGHHGDADVVLQLEPGEVGEITVTFPEDVSFFTEIACLIPGHYEAGMKGALQYG